jgi:hypothetical protein
VERKGEDGQKEEVIGWLMVDADLGRDRIFGLCAEHQGDEGLEAESLLVLSHRQSLTSDAVNWSCTGLTHLHDPIPHLAPMKRTVSALLCWAVSLL